VKPIKTKDFIFMELKRGLFNRQPVNNRSRSLESISPPVKMASALLPLLINYEVEELGADLGKINRSKMLIVLRNRIEQGDMTALLDNGRPVGFAGVNARFNEVCQVGGVYVLPKYRGQGYGYSIVQSHIERLFKKYTRIVLFVSTDNKRALRLYRNVGFSPKGELEQAFLPSLKTSAFYNKTGRSKFR
jgi:ribosomal protein S18 acetylase RimI-like enzyme